MKREIGLKLVYGLQVEARIRGKSSGPWKNIRFRQTIPALDDPTRIMANQTWPETKIGTLVLFFENAQVSHLPLHSRDPLCYLRSFGKLLSCQRDLRMRFLGDCSERRA